MRITKKSYGDELEIIRFHQPDGITVIKVEAFQVPEGYKSFATNNLVHHDRLTGYGVNKDKQKSVDLAVQDLLKLMDQFDTH